MTEPTPVEIDWANLPSKRVLQAQLDRVAMPADAKVLMGKLLETTTEVAGKVVEIGRRIMAFVMEMARCYPHTAFGVVIGLTLSFLVSAIPVLGLVLGPLLSPVLLAFTIGAGALKDWKQTALDLQVEQFGMQLDAEFAVA